MKIQKNAFAKQKKQLNVLSGRLIKPRGVVRVLNFPAKCVLVVYVPSFCVCEFPNQLSVYFPMCVMLNVDSQSCFKLLSIRHV